MRRFRALCLVVVAGSIAAGCGSSSRPQAGGLPVVVLDSPEAQSWVRLLRVSGYAARTGNVSDVLGRTSAVVPGDVPLSVSDRTRIVDWVSKGGRLATADNTLLAEFGITRGAPTTVNAVTMQRLSGTAEWASTLTLRPLTGAALVPLATSVPSHQVVMGRAPSGKGEVVVFAVDPVGPGRAGFELLPEAAAVVGEELRAPVGPKARSAQVFVDPGGLPKDLAHDPQRIASLLAQAGARVAEIAGWNYDFNDPAANYDYASLIKALHARGILAYAWLEPPFVTLRMWQDHPECREKTETGRDARVDWRSLIALENPACFALATESWTRVLTRFPWDGVNVAELYFEPRIKVRNYTPFSAAALAEFGGNPKTQPERFVQFRVGLVTELNRKVLAFVDSLPNAARLGRELTVIDDTLDPSLGRGVGSNVSALAGVAKHAGATLVVEDPHSQWSDGPLRYLRLGRHVASLMPPEDALIDVNVVRRYGGPKPTVQMTGAELGLALGSAAMSLGRIGVYSLGTLTPQDRASMPGALASGTLTTDLGVYGRWTVQVTAPSALDGRLTVDGIQWPAGRGTALVPPGNHVLEWQTGNPVGPGLTAFTGQIGTASVSSKGMTFTYDTGSDGLAVVTARPASLKVDGAAAPLDVVADPDGGFVVRLPRGTHRAELGF